MSLNVSETVAFGDWGFDNSAALTLNLSNWAGTGTGINTIHSIAPKENDAMYTLRGQRISTPAKGINIINGKKVFIK